MRLSDFSCPRFLLLLLLVIVIVIVIHPSVSRATPKDYDHDYDYDYEKIRKNLRCALTAVSVPGQLDRMAGCRYVESIMENTLTITQGQAQFPALGRKSMTTAITRSGEVVSSIVPRQRMADLLEQMEIPANPAAEAINKAEADKYHPLSVLDEH